MTRVILGLGSNKEFDGKSPVSLLNEACDELEKILFDMKKSKIYETQPMYYENQPNFFNMAVSGNVKDDFLPHDLLSEIHKIEAKFGRNREKEIKNGPRTLDIDIEIFGDVVLNDDDLIIPHPRMHERDFVKKPMLEVM